MSKPIFVQIEIKDEPYLKEFWTCSGPRYPEGTQVLRIDEVDPPDMNNDERTNEVVQHDFPLCHVVEVIVLPQSRT